MFPHRHTADPVSLFLTGPMYLHMLLVHTVWDTTPLPIGPLTPPLQHSLSQAPSVPTAPTTVLQELRLVSEEPPHVFMMLSLSPERLFPARAGIHEALTWSPHRSAPWTADSSPQVPLEARRRESLSLLYRPPMQEYSGCGLPGRESNLPGYLTPAAEAPASVG